MNAPQRVVEICYIERELQGITCKKKYENNFVVLIFKLSKKLQTKQAIAYIFNLLFAMSSHRTSLLKLIDLAIGYPSPGSMNLNLLHRILYILAVRDHSGDGDDIEICHLSENVARALISNGDRSGSQTRLRVQRIKNRPSEEQTLKITGSRIVVPYEEHQLTENESSHIESRMSAMSSVVSNLEERVQEISHKPSDVLESEIKELNKRIENLENLVEQQTAKVSIQENFQLEPSVENDLSIKHCEIEQMRSAIAALQDRMNEFHTMVKQNTITTPSVGGVQLDIQHEHISNFVTESVVLAEDGSETARPPEATETMKLPAEAITNLTEVLRKIQHQQSQFEETLKTITTQLEICAHKSHPDLLSLMSAMNEQVQQLRQEWQTAQKTIRMPDEKRAAGTKCKVVQDVRCISCDREVAMDRCDEIVPKPPALGAGRMLKPSLHNQLDEIRKNLDYKPRGGNIARNLDTFEKVYRSLVDRKNKLMN